jgi:MOSC domain-containing protein
MARIASLHIYPVKSCRGIDVDSFLMTPTGPEWDRRWMIVTAADQFITQRTHPKLATITVAIGDGKLRLSAEGQAPLVLDVDHAGDSRPVTIWNDECLGIDAGDAAAAWLSRVLDDKFRLVRIDPRRSRRANPKYVGPDPNPLTFTDGYPILMISNESLAELNRRLPEPLPMARFRPNLVIEGVPAHAEDAMTLFRTDSIVLRGVKLCTRCSVTTTDQLTGARDPHQQPLRALGKYRHDYALKGVVFGQNCAVEAGVGDRLRVGAELSIEAHQV